MAHAKVSWQSAGSRGCGIAGQLRAQAEGKRRLERRVVAIG
jgi:hypothetical protein